MPLPSRSPLKRGSGVRTFQRKVLAGVGLAWRRRLEVERLPLPSSMEEFACAALLLERRRSEVAGDARLVRSLSFVSAFLALVPEDRWKQLALAGPMRESWAGYYTEESDLSTRDGGRCAAYSVRLQRSWAHLARVALVSLPHAASDQSHCKPGSDASRAVQMPRCLAQIPRCRSSACRFHPMPQTPVNWPAPDIASGRRKHNQALER